MNLKNNRCLNWVVCRGLLFFLSLMFSTGCALISKDPPEDLSSPSPSPQDLLEEYTNQHLPIAEPVLPEEFAPLSHIEPKLSFLSTLPFEDQLFSITVTDQASLGQMLSILANQANLSLIVAPNVDRSQPISVNFSKVPLRVALENILSIFDYYYSIENGVLRIQARKTAVFHFDYPLVFNKAKSETGGDVLGGGGGGGGASGTVDALSSTSLAGEFTIEVEVEDEDHLDVWKKIEEALVPAKSGEGGLLSASGSAQISRMGGTIVVSDRPSNLRLVEQYLDRIKRSLHRQVVIEAKIVEVNLNHSHEFGIDWSFIKKNFLSEAGLNLELVPSLSEGLATFTAKIEDTAGTATGTLILDALATQGDVNLLSSPRLNVINNQSAMISVGDVVPHLDFTVGQTTETTDTGNELVVIDSVPVIARTLEGVTLGITPQISEDGDTILHIVPIVTQQTGVRNISIQNENIEFPVFSIRESDTMVKVKDRQTIVIGGLISEQTSDSTKRIPVLGDIPFLDVLFTNQQRSTTKNELVILLTTTVVYR